MTEEENRRRLNLPDRRKNTYQQLEERLDEHIDKIEAYVHRWIKRGLIACAIIGTACVLGLAGFGYVLREVQRQRHEACLNQNRRHDATVKAFRNEAANFLKDHPEQRAAVLASRAANLRIINALAPQQNCDKVAPERNLLP